MALIAHFVQRPQLLKGIIWGPGTPNSSQIGQEICNALVHVHYAIKTSLTATESISVTHVLPRQLIVETAIPNCMQTQRTVQPPIRTDWHRSVLYTVTTKAAVAIQPPVAPPFSLSQERMNHCLCCSQFQNLPFKLHRNMLYCFRSQKSHAHLSYTEIPFSIFTDIPCPACPNHTYRSLAW